MRGLLVLLIGLAACGSKDAPVVEAVEPVRLPDAFQGLWANSFTDCSLAPGSSEEAPIQITVDRFIGLENSCALDVLELSEDGTDVLLVRSCMGEGVEYKDQYRLRLKADTLMAQPEEGGSVTWTRCPESSLTK